MISIPLTPVALALAVTVGIGPAVDAPAPRPDAEAEFDEAEPEAEAEADSEPEPEVPGATEGEAPPVEIVPSGETVPLPAVEAEPDPEPEPEPEPEPSARAPEAERDGDTLDADYDPLRDSPEAIRARGWLRSGIVATSVGVGLGVASVILGSLDPCAPHGGNSCFVDARNRAALTAGIPGAILLAGGVAMLTVGALRLRRMKSTLRASASLHADATGAVLGVRGRF